MPIVTLHPKTVGTLPAIDGRRTDYRDDDVQGLCLRVYPSGKRTWCVVYSWRRGPRFVTQRYTLGPYPRIPLKAAREEARRRLLDVANGKDPAEARRREKLAMRLSVADLAEQAVAALDIRPATRSEWERIVAKDIASSDIGQLPATALRRHEVRAWAERILKRGGYTANRAFGVLRRAYTWGLQRDIIETTPFAGLRPPAREAPNDRVLSTAELRALLRALPLEAGAFADAIELLLLTATRRSMVLGLCRRELDGLDGPEPLWSVPGGREGRSKSGRPHLVPLSAQAVDVIRRRLEIAEGELLFPGLRPTKPGTDVVMAWNSKAIADIKRVTAWALTFPAVEDLKAAIADAKEKKQGPVAVPAWRVHNLRHTAATHMRERLKVAGDVVSMLLAHRPPGAPVTHVYDRAQLLPERRAALVAWGAWLERLRTGASATILPHRPRKRG